jgi:hypothetical protein
VKEPWDDIEEEVCKKVSLNHASSSRQLQLKSTGDEALLSFHQNHSIISSRLLPTHPQCSPRITNYKSCRTTNSKCLEKRVIMKLTMEQ